MQLSLTCKHDHADLYLLLFYTNGQCIQIVFPNYIYYHCELNCIIQNNLNAMDKYHDMLQFLLQLYSANFTGYLALLDITTASINTTCTICWNYQITSETKQGVYYTLRSLNFSFSKNSIPVALMTLQLFCHLLFQFRIVPMFITLLHRVFKTSPFQAIV